MLTFIVLCVVVLMYYMHFRYKRKGIYQLADQIPDVGSLPAIGHVHWFIGKAEQILENIITMCKGIEANGGLGKIWIGTELYVVLLNPEDAQIVLENCLDKDSSYRFLRTWLGNGLFVAPVDLWKMHRRLLLPVFYNKMVEEYIDLFNEQSDILVKLLNKKVGSPEFDVFPFISSCTLDIVFESAMGERMNVQYYPETGYLKARSTVMSIINMRMYKAWLQPNFIFNLTKLFKEQEESIKITHKFSDEVVKKRRLDYQVRSLKHDGPTDVLTQLLQKNSKFTNEELREHIDSITIAGNDTTALVICYTIMLLGVHQEEQEKVYKELKDIFGDSKRAATKDDLNDMKILERAIKESMRLYMVVPVIARTVKQETKLATCTLPPGVNCAIMPFIMHRSKRIWGDDVDLFRPDRFLPENSIGRHPAAFMPFSIGARNCIGRHFGMLTMKSILSNVLRNFKVHAQECKQMKIEILLIPVDGHLIRLERRQS